MSGVILSGIYYQLKKRERKRNLHEEGKLSLSCLNYRNFLAVPESPLIKDTWETWLPQGYYVYSRPHRKQMTLWPCTRNGELRTPGRRPAVLGHGFTRAKSSWMPEQALRVKRGGTNWVCLCVLCSFVIQVPWDGSLGRVEINWTTHRDFRGCYGPSCSRTELLIPLKTNPGGSQKPIWAWPGIDGMGETWCFPDMSQVQ